jgi:glutathione S-transferase
MNMNLYYSPGACSLAAHIAMREAGLSCKCVRVDLMRKTVAADGSNYLAINPMGQVPSLLLADGVLLTECAAVLQYIADLAPSARLAPPAGSLERYRLMSILNFIATELHKAFAPLFHPHTPEDYKAAVRCDRRALLHIEAMLADGRSWLMGEDFSVADAYLFSVLRLGPRIGIALEAFPQTAEFMARAAGRVAVGRALAAEGLHAAAPSAPHPASPHAGSASLHAIA